MQKLVQVVNYSVKPIKIKKVPKIEPSKQLKEEVRNLIKEGFESAYLWEDYKDKFESRRQFGAVVAWANNTLEQKRRRK